MPECCFDPINHTRVRIQKCAICGGLIIDAVPLAFDAPRLSALVPPTAVLGSPNFTLSVRGVGFVADSVIVFAGHDEPTTVVSPTEVTTGVDMSVWMGPDPAIPVLVRHPDGGTSNALTFAFTAADNSGARRGTGAGETSGRPHPDHELPTRGRPAHPDHSLPEPEKPEPKRRG